MRKKAGTSTHIMLLNNVLEILARATWKEEEIKGIQIRKEQIN